LTRVFWGCKLPTRKHNVGMHQREEAAMGTILVIDDEKKILKMLQMALEAYGYRVEVAASGKEGVKKFDAAHFDAVITDLVMPGLDGKEVVRHIRESERSRTPVIGISGTPWLLETADFNSVLAKPFSIVSLVQHLQELAPA